MDHTQGLKTPKYKIYVGRREVTGVMTFPSHQRILNTQQLNLSNRGNRKTAGQDLRIQQGVVQYWSTPMSSAFLRRQMTGSVMAPKAEIANWLFVA